MKHLFIFLLFFITLLGENFAAFAENPTPKSSEILIVYSGNALGELKPCGCDKEEEQGGIERRMTYIKNILKQTRNTLIVDLGDNFKEPTRQGKLKAEFFVSSLAQMKYDAITLGDKDLIYGNKFLEELKEVPWLASNIHLEKMDIPPFIIKNFSNGLKVAIISAADPGLFYVSEHSNFKVIDPQRTVKNIIEFLKNKENPNLIVLLSHMRRVDGLKMLNIEGIDVVINGHIEKDTDKIDMEPLTQEGKIFVQPGPLGQKMGEIRIQFQPDGKLEFKQKMVKLDSKIANDKQMTELYEVYNSKVEELFFASLEERKKKAQMQIYATQKTCQNCHPEAHKTWVGSQHSRAYETLKRVNKSFDPECLICHTTGFNKEGGFLSEMDTPELKNVQCEMCHGPQLEHSKAPTGGFAKKANTACKQCHIKKHSPKFDFEKYWPKIQH